MTEIDITNGMPMSDEQRAALVDRYDGEVTFLDLHLGRLLASLRRLGRYDESLIIIVGDHGEMLGEHSLLDHGQALYEELIRVPLAVRYPLGRDGGTQSGSPVSVVDILQLACGELGLPVPPESEGLPIGERQTATAESRSAYFVQRYGERFDRDLQCVIRWPWKLVVSSTSKTSYTASTRDSRNGQPRGQPVRDELLAELEAQLASCRCQQPPTLPRELDDEKLDQLRKLGYVQ